MPPSTSNALVPVDTLTSDQIQSYLDSYPAALAYKASLSSTASTPGNSLLDLDEWYQSLPPLLTTSSLSHGIKGKSELEKLMRWKLSREKHRPTLLSLIKSNPASTCTELLTRASTHLLSHCPALSLGSSPTEELLKAVEGTMRILAELKGVGPATSSAIVASWVDYGVFQSDELVMGLMGKGVKIDYSWAFYKKFYRLAVESLKKLRKDGRVKSGKEMERVGWSMFYSPTSLAGSKETKKEAEHEGVTEEQGAKEEEKGTAKRKPVVKKEAKVEEEPGESSVVTGRRTSKRLRTTK